MAGWTAVSGCDERQTDAEIMAQRSDGFWGHLVHRHRNARRRFPRPRRLWWQLRRGSPLHPARLDIWSALQAFRPRDLRALLADNPLQLGNLTQKPHHELQQLAVRQAGGVGWYGTHPGCIEVHRVGTSKKSAPVNAFAVVTTGQKEARLGARMVSPLWQSRSAPPKCQAATFADRLFDFVRRRLPRASMSA